MTRIQPIVETLTRVNAVEPNPGPLESPGSPIGVIETDTFCEKCGFNLHSQKVYRDGRLGLLIVRCTECGGYQSAHQKTTAASNWLHRLALAGLLLWVGIGLAFLSFVFFGLVGTHVAAVDGLLVRQLMTLNGQPVVQEYIATTNPAANGIFKYRLEADAATEIDADKIMLGRLPAPWLPGGKLRKQSWGGNYATPMQAAIIAVIFAIILFGVSATLASASWFWRRGFMWLWLLLPVGAFCFDLIGTFSERNYTYGGQTPVQIDKTSEVTLAAVVLGLQLLVMAIGLYLGRPIARLFLRGFIPPRARQLFVFLWHCDGKTMPAARTSGEPRA